jgi:flagellar biosynthesis/type III secretory pathway protein FliH
MADEIAERYSSGLNDGLEQGRVEGMIELGSALNMSDAEILSTLQKQLNISEQQARAYLDKYRGK